MKYRVISPVVCLSGCRAQKLVLMRAARAFSRGRGWWLFVVVALCQRGCVLFTISCSSVAVGCRGACDTAPRSGA